MQIVTRKSEVKEYLSKCISVYHLKGLSACVKEVEKQILIKKVKFPLLEFCGDFFYQNIATQEHIEFCDRIEQLKAEGGNVLLGKILQNRLSEHYEESLHKATEYISKADIWYVCDIIGERVFGISLLNEPIKTIPYIKKLSSHESNCVIRSLGAGIHYSIKKGLDKKNAKFLFQILLSRANSKDKEIRQGIGWAAKTTAKFHPEIIERFQKEIQNKETVSNWFRKKIDIGLKRNLYAKGS